MAKIRHIAIQVPDLEKAAAFYEGAFGLERVNQVESPIGNAISLSDGTMNLTLLHFPEGTQGQQRRAGLGRPASHRLHGRGRKNHRQKDREFSAASSSCNCRAIPESMRKRSSRILNGIVFDVSEHDWRQSKAS